METRLSAAPEVEGPGLAESASILALSASQFHSESTARDLTLSVAAALRERPTSLLSVSETGAPPSESDARLDFLSLCPSWWCANCPWAGVGEEDERGCRDSAAEWDRVRGGRPGRCSEAFLSLELSVPLPLPMANPPGSTGESEFAAEDMA